MYGAFNGTVVSPAAMAKAPQGSASFPWRVSQISYLPGWRPLTRSSIGQFPAASTSNRSSCAVAWLAPDMATVRTGSARPPAPPTR
jgi:hypothetical protein